MCTAVVVAGLAGLLMSQIWPSLMHEAAALWIAMKTVMSWQPTLPLKGGATTVGWAITLAVSGAASGTETIENLPNGCWHVPPMLVEPIAYDDTYRSTRPLVRSGTSVCVWEPQSVRTAWTKTGLAGLVMSKIRMPSQPFGSLAVVSVALLWPHTVAPLTCGRSTDWKRSRRPLCCHRETSFWGPRQRYET